MDTLGKYEIISELGRGGMGIVYKARDPVIGRLVALKTLTTELLNNPDSLKRFYREAQAAGSLQHDNLVTIFELGEVSGQPYIAMEFVEGESLREFIAKRVPMTLPQKLKIIKQFCSGLNYAHQHGLVHRDVKPGNILVRKDGTAKVVDFGIVHVESTSMTKTGIFMGTVQYASPEQLNNGHVDARSDIFSVGVVIYELLTYQRPFDAPTVASVINQILNRDPVPLTEVMTGVPPELETIVNRCLQKDPENRFSSLQELILELDPLASTLQHNLAQELVAQVPALIEHRELTRARDLLRDALMLESSHPLAKTLMNEVNAEIKRLELSAKVGTCIEEGQALLEKRDYEGAVKSLEGAVKLDSHHGEALALLANAREELAQARQIQQCLAAARNAYRSGDLTQAEGTLTQVLELDKGNADAQAILVQIRRERAERERRFRLGEALWEVRGLLERARYEDALSRLDDLQKEFPGEAEVEDLVREAQQKSDALRGEVRAIRALLDASRFQEAVERAGTLAAGFPQRSEVTELYESAKRKLELAERRRALEADLGRIQRLVDGGNYAKAVEECEASRKRFPHSIELERLTVLANSQKQAQEVEQQVEASCHHVQALLDARQYDDAASQAERELARFPGSPELVRLLVSARRSQFEASRQPIPTPSPASRRDDVSDGAETLFDRLSAHSEIEAAQQAPVEAPLSAGPEEAYNATQIFVPHSASTAGASGLSEHTVPEHLHSAVETEEPASPVAQTPGQEAQTHEDWAPSPPNAVAAWLQRRILLAATGAIAIVVLAIVVVRSIHKPPKPPRVTGVALTFSTSPPGGVVSIDGTAIGASSINVEPGSHTVTATKEGYAPISEPLDVAQGMGSGQVLTLTPLPLKLQLDTGNLKNVTVKWDGQPADSVTSGQWSREVEARPELETHTLEVNTRDGSAKFAVEVTAAAFPNLNIEPKFKNLELVAVSSFGGQPRLQFDSALTKVSVDDQLYDSNSAPLGPSNFTTAIHRLSWDSGASHMTKEFETGSSPELAIFLVRPAASKVSNTKVTPAPAPPEQPSAATELQQQITVLQKKAYDAGQTGRYAEPEGDNAIYYANRVLEADPKNSYVPTIRDWSVSQEKHKIHDAVASNDFQSAERMAGSLVKLLPEDSAVADLQKQVKAAEEAAAKPAQPSAPKAVLSKSAAYIVGKKSYDGTLIIVGQRLKFDPSPGAGGQRLDIPCSAITVKQDGWPHRNRFHVIAEGKTYDFQSQDTTSDGVHDACTKH